MKVLSRPSTLPPSNIPLHCNICPKKPDFSDVSHLLTHIASKGHLSTYYKIKVKASSEDAPSRQLIEQYDTWYAHWHIEDLMSDRLNLKDKRKARPRGTGHVQPAPMPQYNFPQLYAPFMGHVPHEHPVDPRLLPHGIKMEDNSRSATPTSAFHMDPTANFGGPYPYGNHTPWHAQPWMYMMAKQEYEEEASSETSHMPSAGTTLSTVADNKPMANDLGGLEVIEVHETSKLKGVFWPGMDMFDAAPPEQRRKRNQKKDTSVVKHLEVMSQMIEATEHVFSPLGTHCKSRPISGLLDSDDSPLPGEETPPRPTKAKRAPRRKPLAEKDINAGRKPPGKPQKRGRPPKPTPAPTMKPKRARAARNNLASSARTETKQSASPKSVGAATFERPAEMSFLTSAFHPPHFQGDESGQAAPTTYRLAETGYTYQQQPQHQGYFTHPSQAYYALPSNEMSWDMFTHHGIENGTGIGNPLFMGNPSMDLDDDEQTISVVDSDE